MNVPRLAAALLCTWLLSSAARAHFVFLVPHDDSSAKVVLSEDLKVDEKVKIAKVTTIKLFARSDGAPARPLAFTAGEHHLDVAATGTGPRVIYGLNDYGVLARDGAKPFRLAYYPKAVVGPLTEAQSTVGPELPVEIVLRETPDGVRLGALVDGKPAPKTDIIVVDAAGELAPEETAADGFTKPLKLSGRIGAYFSSTKTESGEKDGKAYEEARNYATLVVELPTES
jgi:hypothetical protein